LFLVIGFLGFALILSTGAGYFYTKRYRKKFQVLSDAEIEMFQNGDPSAAAADALLLPYNYEIEIPRSEIDFGSHITIQQFSGLLKN
jgi:hypothetical protein